MKPIFCPYVNGCPFYDEHIVEESFGPVADKYCESDGYSRCARYKLRSASEEVPDNLWPNGEER